MTLMTVEGVYRDGKVELPEVPPGAPAQARVLVTFLPVEATADAKPGALATRDTRRAAIDRLLARMRQGIDFGGPPYPKREELYDRVNRYEQRVR
jgi:hypothetical protein